MTDTTHEITIPVGMVDAPIHVVPLGDLFEHAESYLCDCIPSMHYRDAVTSVEVWVHRRVSDPMEQH